MFNKYSGLWPSNTLFSSWSVLIWRVPRCALRNKGIHKYLIGTFMILVFIWNSWRKAMALNAMSSIYFNNDVIKWKHFLRYWPFVRGIHQWPVDTQHKGQWRGALMFDLRLNKRLSKQSRRWWFETPLRSLWRQRHIYVYSVTLPSLKIMNITCQLWEGSKKQFLRRGEINEVDWQVNGTS